GRAAGPGGGGPGGPPPAAARDPWARREAMRSGRSRCPPTDKVRYLADVCLGDYSLAHFPRLKAARERLFEARAEICPERPSLITDYYLEHGFETGPDGRERHPALRQAEALAYLLERRRPIVRDDDILAGTTTSKEIGVVVYPEFHGTAIWSELTTVTGRDLNPYLIDPETADVLDRKVFPYWSERNVREWSRRVNGNPECQRLDERWALYFMWKTAALSHTIPDFSLVLRRGLADLAREAREREEAAARLGPGASDHTGPSNHPDASDRATYYRAMRVALEGVLTYARHLAEEAERMAADLPVERAARRAELLELARICRKVPAQPAETLHEAVQAVWLVWVALHMENSNAGLSLGRLDQVLQPYFAADAERALAEVAERFSRAGSGTGEEAARAQTGPDLEAARAEALRAVIERAIELVGWLFLKCADHLPLVPNIGNLLFAGSSSDQALTVGGVDASGETAVCDMTYVILKVTELLGLRDPNVNARFCPGVNSVEYLRRLCEVNLITAATPSLHNDNAVIRALVNQGFAVEHARDWAATGCVEPTSVGRHFGHTNCMLLNLVAPLEMALYDGVHPLVGTRVGPSTGDPAAGAFPTFESFKEAYKTHLRYLIEKSIEYNDQLGRAHQYLHPTPLLSSLIEGPMEKGRDLTAGAATYNSSGAALVALTDVVDSLMTIKDLVYERRLVDWPTLLEALRADFRGFEPLHATIMTKVPKFGQDAEEPRALAQELIDFIYEVYQSHVNYRGGRYTTGFWSMSNHVIFGVLSGALPSGRRKGLPFTPGITPAPGATDQLLPAIRTIAALDPLKMPNNIAFNVKLVPGPGDSHQKTLDQFTAYVRTYFELGGMQMQFNVVSTKTLREAMENPDAYRWLLVRISGYNAYFVDLNRDMQLELIARTEFRT
ncbi:MAG: formate acetyltransferase, partial [Firmicutes bacterium]|nr:formate acetyltransferase [Bacillota bacterium]